MARLEKLRSFEICDGMGMLSLEDPLHVLAACKKLSDLSTLRLCFHTPHHLKISELVPELKALKELVVGDCFLKQPNTSISSLQERFPEVLVTKCTCHEFALQR